MRVIAKKITVLAAVYGLCLGCLFLSINSLAMSQDSATLTIDVAENICILNILVKPEKRIPSSNNWSTLVTVQIFQTDNTGVGTLTGRSDNQGLAVIDICAQNVQLVDNTGYNIYVRGLSHLRKSYPNFTIKLGPQGLNDFSTSNKVLLAGETSPIFDNYINSLDLSTQAKNFRRTDDEKDDLNHEGIVNALDISNTAYNFRKVGE